MAKKRNERKADVMHVVQRYQAHNQSFMALLFRGAVSKAWLVLLITSQ